MLGLHVLESSNGRVRQVPCGGCTCGATYLQWFSSTIKIEPLDICGTLILARCSQETQCTDPDQWPCHVLSSSITRLPTEWILLPLQWVSYASLCTVNVGWYVGALDLQFRDCKIDSQFVCCITCLALTKWHNLIPVQIWCYVPSVLWHCWLGGRKGIRPVKNWVVGCWHCYLSGARCRLAYGPADAIATHCLLLK